MFDGCVVVCLLCLWFMLRLILFDAAVLVLRAVVYLFVCVCVLVCCCFWFGLLLLCVRVCVGV